MSVPPVTEITTLSIEKLVYEGWGLARAESGSVVFVPYAAPDDKLTTKEPFRQNKRVMFAEIDELISPSPRRVKPVCDAFGECGGCQWQHLSYEEQLKWKQTILLETFQRLGKIEEPPIGAIIPSPDTLKYRNHVTWHVDGDDLGFQAWRQHRVVTTTQCYLLPDELNTLQAQTSAILKTMNEAHRPNRVDVRWNSALDVMMTWAYDDFDPEMKSFIKKAAQTLCDDAPLLKGFLIDNGEELHALLGDSFLEETLEDITFRISAGAFFQANASLLPTLLSHVLALIPDGVDLLDVYAGGGLFALPAAKKVNSVVAIESSPLAADDFQMNAIQNNIENASCHTGEAERILPTLELLVDVAIVDPPRAGCKPAVLTALTDAVTQRLIYVSCDPTTLARDTRLLLDTKQWTLASLQSFDMFPQTYHIETIAVFEKLTH